MSEIKERPIIFGAESIRAIIEGQKAQTRRVIKNPDKYDRIRECGFCCPYGQPGERLWVRETFALESNYNIEDERRYPPPHADGRPVRRVSDAEIAYWEQCHYRATDPPPELSCEHEACDGGEPCARVWKSPMFMPRWASRISLELTAVRVERLQEISESDAIAEGVDRAHLDSDITLARGILAGGSLAVDRYARAWDELNAKRGFPWDSNPFVWVLSFKRVEREACRPSPTADR